MRVEKERDWGGEFESLCVAGREVWGTGNGEQGAEPPTRAGLLMLDQRRANEVQTGQEVWEVTGDRG